jgi:malonyl-CoA/methylmalonyl-CoA synthetase
MTSIPLIARAGQFVGRTSVLAEEGQFTYQQLLDTSAEVADTLLDGKHDLGGARVAFLTPPSMTYVAVQWGIWRAGGIAVPLCVQHPEPELAYVLDDAVADIVVAHPDFADRLQSLASGRGLQFALTSNLVNLGADAMEVELPEIDSTRDAMLVYTSGTTSRPKGAVTTHDNIAAQVAALIESWGWSADDHILEVLPLHHVHGIVNVVACALWAGATCEILPKFDCDRVWDRIIAGDGLTLFMAVPTVYARLIKAWDAAAESRRQAMTDGCRKLRLMVSGSAALPVPMLEKWRQVSGHTLLERYGMTEIGMALSNPLEGERRPGYVGRPLPRVELQLVDEHGQQVAGGQPGQIQVKGPAVFSRYWHKPGETAAAFTADGWFKTGDVAVLEDDVYRILGRESVDIIKTGGYKVSALEIEDLLQTHEAVAECAVVGVADEEWGQRVAAAVVCKPGHVLDIDGLRNWGKEQLAPYKLPTLLRLMDALPRNPLGKVTKPVLVRQFETSVHQDRPT